MGFLVGGIGFLAFLVTSLRSRFSVAYAFFSRFVYVLFKLVALRCTSVSTALRRFAFLALAFVAVAGHLSSDSLVPPRLRESSPRPAIVLFRGYLLA